MCTPNCSHTNEYADTRSIIEALFLSYGTHPITTLIADTALQNDTVNFTLHSIIRIAESFVASEYLKAKGYPINGNTKAEIARRLESDGALSAVLEVYAPLIKDIGGNNIHVVENTLIVVLRVATYVAITETLKGSGNLSGADAFVESLPNDTFHDITHAISSMASVISAELDGDMYEDEDEDKDKDEDEWDEDEIDPEVFRELFMRILSEEGHFPEPSEEDEPNTDTEVETEVERTTPTNEIGAEESVCSYSIHFPNIQELVQTYGEDLYIVQEAAFRSAEAAWDFIDDNIVRELASVASVQVTTTKTVTTKETTLITRN